jgi:hypothetical protein
MRHDRPARGWLEEIRQLSEARRQIDEADERAIDANMDRDEDLRTLIAKTRATTADGALAQVALLLEELGRGWPHAEAALLNLKMHLEAMAGREEAQ